MSNETMPVEIFTPPVKNLDGYYLADEMNVPGDVSYTRTDTIPSRAEVAREFFEAVNNYYDQGWTGMTWYGCAKKVLQEWEDAENS